MLGTWLRRKTDTKHRMHRASNKEEIHKVQTK